MMMIPRKRRRKNLPSPTLPADLLLEIIARSDIVTLIHCTAVCKSLRRDILSASFIGRVTKQGGLVPPNVLAYLHTRPTRNRSRNLGPLISLVHPATPAASCFVDNNLAHYVMRRALDLLRRFEPLTSRGGLVLLRRRPNISMSISECFTDLCVFNPMTGDRAYVPGPPGLRSHWNHKYILLTAADGIGCSFLLLAFVVGFYNNNNGGCKIIVKTIKSSSTSWDRVASNGHRRLPSGSLQDRREAVVLHGNIIHWLLSGGRKILTYDIRKEWLGTLKLPPAKYAESQRLLGTSPDGSRLQFVAAESFIVSVWLQVRDGWEKEAVIDVEQNLRSMLPSIAPDCMWIEFECSGERNRAVLLRAYRDGLMRRQGPLIVLDLDTREMNMQEPYPSLLLQIDLSQQLQAMKIFS